MFLLNIREEPVVFVKQEFDYIPYSPRDQDSVESCLQNKGLTSTQLTDMEVTIRKAILDLASLRYSNHYLNIEFTTPLEIYSPLLLAEHVSPGYYSCFVVSKNTIFSC